MTAEELRAAVAESIAQRDEQWHKVLETVTVQFHADLQKLERRIKKSLNELRADVAGVVSDRRRMNERLTEVENKVAA